MFNIQTQEIKFGDKVVTLETGKVARQATGSVVARMGDTVVLCTVVAEKKAKEGVDFFPLTVHYQDKFYADGRVPGGFLKRENRPSERETLLSRLIDRPIRPLFPASFKNEVQIICMVTSYDEENPADIVAMIGASAALSISGIPFQGPIGAAKVGFKDGEYILNPTPAQLLESDLDLSVAGTKDAVLMVESEAKELTEEQMLGAVNFGQEAFKAVIEGIEKLTKKAGKEKWEVIEEDNSEINKIVEKAAKDGICKAYKLKDKQERSSALSELKDAVKAELIEGKELDELKVMSAFKNLEKDLVRGEIISKKQRIDGRKEHEIRQIVPEVDLLPKAHGSALFTRGETQALVVTTLGTGEDEQIIDDIEGTRKTNFMLHYNFPPYSVGEAGRIGAPGRREIGHGKLAYRAIKAMIPSKEEFPYTLRIVSEITESNGSSSMATVCGASMSMMAAGVPMASPVAGIAMGLIKEGKKFSVLSDIMGDEDHLGDMDFKVAGTEKGITALQMDIKIAGITNEIMDTALKQAKDGRLHILGEMANAISESRKELSSNAPQMESFEVPKDKIGEIIGPGGKNIKQIVEQTEAKVDINDDGIVSVSSVNKEQLDAAVTIIKNIIAVPEIGTIYKGKVSKIVDFGAFVSFMHNKEGLVHVSEIAEERVENPRDYVSEGQEIDVKVIGMDRGKVKLSMKLGEGSGSKKKSKKEDQFEVEDFIPGNTHKDEDSQDSARAKKKSESKRKFNSSSKKNDNDQNSKRNRSDSRSTYKKESSTPEKKKRFF